jgi:hypothetical protein
MYDMAGEGYKQAILSINFAQQLNNRLTSSGYRAASSDLRVRTALIYTPM